MIKNDLSFEYNGTLVKVLDGDTIDNLYRFRFRFENQKTN